MIQKISETTLRHCNAYPASDQFFLYLMKTQMEVVVGVLSTGFDPYIEAPPYNVAALWPRGNTFLHVETRSWILRRQ